MKFLQVERKPYAMNQTGFHSRDARMIPYRQSNDHRTGHKRFHNNNHLIVLTERGKTGDEVQHRFIINKTWNRKETWLNITKPKCNRPVDNNTSGGNGKHFC